MLVISFSGGRSSAMMAKRLLDSEVDDYEIIFCNTGKEMPQTLDFVNDCSNQWDVPITWLEYRSLREYQVVDYSTASRAGEPFYQLITDKNYLPNMVARFCTSELKVVTIDRYLKSKGVEDYSTAVGIRADEPRRVAKMRKKDGYITPLADAKVTTADVIEFWRDQSFDLNLPASGFYSNCDLCFLKGYGIKQSLVREQPSLAEWWDEQEKRIDARFRSDQPSYESMIIASTNQDDLFGFESTPCFCGD